MNCSNLNNNFKKLIASLIFLIFVVVVGNRALLSDVVYESDDYLHHAARTANYYLALKQGQFPVRWAPNLNYSYGYPSFNYMYHTPYMVGSFFHLLNFSVQQSMNLSVLLSILLGAVGCFIFVRSYKISNQWSMILSLIFVFNPYTLLSIYWRGAVGELYFYGLIPFLLLFIRKLILTKKYSSDWKLYFAGISLTTALIILSHLPSVIILLPLLAIFIFTEFNQKPVPQGTLSGFTIHLAINKIIPILLSGFIGLLLSSWYWAPAYFEQWMIAYQSGSSLSQHLDQFASLTSILDIRKDFYSSDIFLNVVQIGGSSAIALVVGSYLAKNNKKIVYWLALVVTAIFFLSNYSKSIWDTSSILQYVQYPWRMLWVVTFASIMILISFIKTKNLPIIAKKITAGLLLIGVIFSTEAYTHTKGSTSRTDFDWYQTFATGSSFDEHRPIWSETPYDFPEELLFVDSANNVRNLSELSPSIISLNGTKIEYIISPKEDIIAIHKRLFYPGWEAHLDGSNVEFEDNLSEYSGVLAIKIPAKESRVKIEFTGYTKLRKFTELLSLFSLVAMILFVLIPAKKAFTKFFVR